MKTSVQNIARSRAAVAMLSLSATLAPTAFADVKYTEVMSIERDGKLAPMSTITTYLKDGLERTDTSQDLGMYKTQETRIRKAATKQTFTLDPALKIYTVDGPGAEGNNGGAGTAGAKTTSTGAKGTGKIVWTVNTQFLGTEKLAGYDARHYKTNQNMVSSGCCGTSDIDFKTEVWMADVKLPVYNDGTSTEAWQRGFGSGRNDCQITFERKGDTKTYDEAMRGLALKTLNFDAKTGKVASSREITLIVFPKLGDGEFGVPAEYKKVSADEYQKARTQAMMAAFAAPKAGDNGDAEEEPESENGEETKPVRTETRAKAVEPAPAKAPDEGDVAEEVVKETAKQKVKQKLRLPW